MIYFWSKYNNIRMDFSDFSEFIGPLIFGLIAWLSNYFGKKKKQPKDVIEPVKEKTENNESFKAIFDDLLPENQIFTKPEENIIEDQIPINKPEKEIIEDSKFEDNKDAVPKENLSSENEVDKIHETKFKKKTIREKLKNKNSLKDAIIMKEILDRKY